MDGCGHCDKFNSTWDELVSFYKDNNKVKLFKYDINEGKGKELATTYKINSAPTIKIINNDTSYEYNGNRQADDIKKFVESKLNSK